jgi:hypothetical protein
LGLKIASNQAFLGRFSKKFSKKHYLGVKIRLHHPLFFYTVLFTARLAMQTA